MAWTAEITDKIIVDGLLKVTVQFSDGKQVFKERYETKNLQDANWLNDAIKRTIINLDSVVAFVGTISTGIYDIKPQPTPQPTDTAVIYLDKLRKLRTLKNLVDLEIITADNKDYLALKQYLITNYNFNYFD
jgi:hypothetical protein